MQTLVLRLSGVDGFGCSEPIFTALRQHWKDPLDVEIRRHRAKRTLDQNAYLHALPFPMIAAYVGDSIESVKLDLMGEFWGWEECHVSGHLVPVKPHTASMSVEECTAFIDWLIPFAAQKFNGMQIPLPNEPLLEDR